MQYPGDGGEEDDWRTNRCAVDSVLPALSDADYPHSGVQTHGLQELSKGVLLRVPETAIGFWMAMRFVLFEMSGWSGSSAGNGRTAGCDCHYEECVPSLLNIEYETKGLGK